MPCHLLLAKLAAVAPSHVLTALEGLVDPMAATLTFCLGTVGFDMAQELTCSLSYIRQHSSMVLLDKLIEQAV